MPDSSARATGGEGPAVRGSADGRVSGATIRLEGLTKRYPGSAAPAVENVDMEIGAGELLVLVGPSGCGKSTTLRMINRLIEPSAGRIRIDDEDVTGMDAVRLRRRIGYAIQASGLFPHMTVGQNIAQVPRMLGWSRSRVRERVEEMLELVGLDAREFHGRYPRQLSGGQQQRVGVARALAADPPVLLMDEPFGAVDPVTRDHLQDELLRLQRELRKTIVFVTHDFDEAVRLGDRIAVLRERSRIAQLDTPQAILTRPADGFVSGFVGSGAALKRLHLTAVRDLELTGGAGPETSGGLRTLSGDATLRDALEAVLTEPSGRVAVTGPDGSRTGVLDMETLTRSFHGLLDADRAAAHRPARPGGVEDGA